MARRLNRFERPTQATAMPHLVTGRMCAGHYGAREKSNSCFIVVFFRGKRTSGNSGRQMAHDKIIIVVHTAKHPPRQPPGGCALFGQGIRRPSAPDCSLRSRSGSPGPFRIRPAVRTGARFHAQGLHRQHSFPRPWPRSAASPDPYGSRTR